MSDIEPTHGPDDDQPTHDGRGGVRLTKHESPRLAGAVLVSSLVIFPLMIVSVVAIGILFSENSPEWDVAIFCAFQITVLALIWNYLRKSASWATVLLGLLIAVGFYLLSIGMCASLIS